ncbi:MAG TPA: MBL fold metallo-hydrolase [Longimicrobiaceae bacterium]|nr:MBL fold metallo-hydrolase [Longimicrobiaceae bacterium]
MSPPRAGASAPVALRATCWGTRGSIPTPGPATVRFGGNTSCVEVCTGGGRRYVFDAGTGIRGLSRRMQDEAHPADADVFVSHYHWDHIQGFPFCAPLYDPSSHIRLHGPRQGDVAIDRAFAGQMSPVYFPVPLEALAAEVEFVDVDGTPWTDGDVEVAAFRLRHPGVTYGYRVRHGGAVLAYVPDNELGGAEARWYDQIVEFVRGADLLIHDAMFTDAEYVRLQGWGHSTFAQAVRLAEDAGVRRLRLFHHAPDRSDAELELICGELLAELAGRGSALELGIATEGEEIALAGGEG